MERSVEPPERTAINAVLESYGTIIDTGWQRSIYPHFDAFLSATRSIAEIIKCCFGVDDHRAMTDWFDQLPAEEQDRRRAFWKQFQVHYDRFCGRLLCGARRVSEHRTGLPPVTVTISGMFWVIHGGPATLVPISETQPFIPLPLDAMPVPVRPHWDDFDIEGQ